MLGTKMLQTFMPNITNPRGLHPTNPTNPEFQELFPFFEEIRHDFAVGADRSRCTLPLSP